MKIFCHKCSDAKLWNAKMNGCGMRMMGLNARLRKVWMGWCGCSVEKQQMGQHASGKKQLATPFIIQQSIYNGSAQSSIQSHAATTKNATIQQQQQHNPAVPSTLPTQTETEFFFLMGCPTSMINALARRPKFSNGEEDVVMIKYDM
jgi:hypothetical protein